MKDEKHIREKSKVIGKHLRTHNSLITGVDNPLSLNATYYVLESGEITCSFVTNKFHQGHDNMVHGGIISAVLDEAMGRTNIDFMTKGKVNSVVTGEYNVRFLKPVVVGEKVTCFAKRDKKEGRKNFCSSVLVDKDNFILAKAKGIFINVDSLDDMTSFLDIEGNSTILNENDPKEL